MKTYAPNKTYEIVLAAGQKGVLTANLDSREVDRLAGDGKIVRDGKAAAGRWEVNPHGRTYAAVGCRESRIPEVALNE